MYIITIKTESTDDVDAIKRVLEDALEEGVIEEGFELKLDEK